MESTNYLVFNEQNACIGVGFTPDGTVPKNAIACTEAQATNWQGSILNDGDIESIAPAPTTAQIAATRKADILVELQVLDMKRIRPIAENEPEILAELNAQALLLRNELKSL